MLSEYDKLKYLGPNSNGRDLDSFSKEIFDVLQKKGLVQLSEDNIRFLKEGGNSESKHKKGNKTKKCRENGRTYPNFDRLYFLLKILSKIGVNIDNLDFIIPEKSIDVRKDHINIIYIREYDKTILLTRNYYGVALLVNGKVGINDVVNQTKEDLIKKNGGIDFKIVKNDIKNLKIFLQKFIIEWNGEDIKNIFIQEIKSKYSVEEFMGLNHDNRDFRVFGVGLITVGKIILGNDIKNPNRYIKSRALLAKEIYGDGYDFVNCYLLSKDDIIEKIQNDFIVEEFMDISNQRVIKYKIGEMGLGSIANTFFGIKVGNVTTTYRDRAFLAQKIYGKGYELIDNELKTKKDYRTEIIKEFPTPESFMISLNSKLKYFKVYGKGVKYIANQIFNLKLKDPISYPNQRAHLAQMIYGKGHEVINAELWNKQDWIVKIKQRYSKDEFLSIGSEEIKKIRFGKRGFKYIVNNIFGLKVKDPFSKDTRKQLSEIIYGNLNK